MSRFNSTTLQQAARQHRDLSFGALAAQLWTTLLHWQERARSRHVLSMMDESALKDIGLSRSMAEGEINKPFWRG